jgi:hypothetical protein
MGIPGTGSRFFRYLLISAGNSSHKAGDENAPQDRVETLLEANPVEGDYRPPGLERTKAITAVYQRLIIAGRTLRSGRSRLHKAPLSQLCSYQLPIPAGRHASMVPFCFLLPQTMGFATSVEDSNDLDK